MCSYKTMELVIEFYLYKSVERCVARSIEYCLSDTLRFTCRCVYMYDRKRDYGNDLSERELALTLLSQVIFEF